MILKEIYHKEFMRRKVDEQYLQKYENVIVLGERFIEYCYVLMFQAQDGNKLAFYLLIENVKKPYLVKAKHYSNKDGYYTANKTIFRNKRLKSKLHNNGLHANKKNKENEYPTSFLIHRLVVCLYQNIFDHEIHHINKANQQNNVCNLVKLRQKRHKWVDSLPINIGIAISLRMQLRQKRKIFKIKRQTLAQNEKLILEILKKEKKDEKEKNEKICKNKKYEIKKYFFYTKEFLKWYETFTNKGFPALNVKFVERWKYILQFDSLEILETTEIIEKPNRRRIMNIGDDFSKGCLDVIF